MSRHVARAAGLAGALIFLVVFVSCFLTWKAIGSLRNRRKSDAVPVEAQSDAVAVEARPPRNPRGDLEPDDFQCLGRSPYRCRALDWLGGLGLST